MWRWLLVLTCIFTIIYLSNQPFDEQDLRLSLIRHEQILNEVRELPPVSFSYGGQEVDSRSPADFIQFWLRKGAHLTIYGTLGLALSLALFCMGITGIRRWAIAGVLVALVGSLDEWHQLYVPGRTGRVIDVVLDLGGYFLFAVIAHLYKKMAETKKSTK